MMLRATCLVRPALRLPACRSLSGLSGNREFCVETTNVNITTTTTHTEIRQEGIATPPREWDERFASLSEAIIKAEQSTHPSMEQLQQMTIQQLLKADSNAGTAL